MGCMCVIVCTCMLLYCAEPGLKEGREERDDKEGK